LAVKHGLFDPEDLIVDDQDIDRLINVEEGIEALFIQNT